jgi:malate dehydrogenase (oxaloacetate-decarboxylating)
LLEIYSKIPVKDEHILKSSTWFRGPWSRPKSSTKPGEVFELTPRGNLVGVVSDGSAVLGLGNIGGRAALPVMEGKAILFHTFAGVEAFPHLPQHAGPDEIIEIVKRLEPTFGGINLEDISAPRCFYIEKAARANRHPHFPRRPARNGRCRSGRYPECLPPDRQEPGDLTIVVNGAGASAVAVTKLLMAMGVQDVILLDTAGRSIKGAKG